MLNRAAVILKYRGPAVRWINEADHYNEDPGISAESLMEERTIYLISEDDEHGGDRGQSWIKANFEALFEAELEGWYTDPTLWPEGRTLKLFHEWFKVEYHSVIVDTVGGELYDDEA